MRARNIKPGFFKNDFLADVSHSARLLFIAMWCMADKSGYIEYRPKRIKVDAFPYEPNIKIEKLLDELINFVEFIGDQNSQFIKVKNFDKHQSPHRNEKPSDFEHLNTYQVITCNFTEFLPDSLIEDSLIPDSVGSTEPTKKMNVFDVNGSFSQAWLLYPNKCGKKEAFTHYKASVKDNDTAQDVLIAMGNYKKHLELEEWKKPQNGSTWFNNWLDWFDWSEPKPTCGYADEYDKPIYGR